MNLQPTQRELELDTAAREAFASRSAAPPADTFTEACVVAAAAGREAPDRAYVFGAIARLLGHAGDGEATVAFARTGNVCHHVPRAAVASTVVIPLGDSAVADVVLASTERTPQPTIDDPHAGDVVLGSGWDREGRAHDVRSALTRALVLIAADCAGAAAAALDATVDRVRERPLRGGTLADLQVVRHRLADLAIDATACRDAVLDAASRVDRGDPEPDVRLAAVRAKAVAVDRGRRVTYEALRLAGGIGILEEHPWPRWFRRVKSAEPLLGSPRDHRAELARAALSRFR